MTHVDDLFPHSDFIRATEDRLITIRHDGAGLRILNYSDAALYTAGAWDNPAVRACRGLIVDESGFVVARPWAKFFNHGQAEAGELNLNASVEVTDKLDGSLGIIYRNLAGELRVATRGSFESDQALHATEVLREKYAGHLTLVDQITPLVEIIYPANRIVVDYDDLDDLVLLGAVEIGTGRHYGPDAAASLVNWSGPRAKTFEYPTLRDAIAAPPRSGMEGLCARDMVTGQIVKIKQDDYVRLHRIVTGLSERTVWAALVAGERLEDLLAPLPDELHDWTRNVWERIDLAACAIEGRARDIHHLILDKLEPGWSRGQYAEHAKSCPPIPTQLAPETPVPATPLLFQLLDGRDPRPSILRQLRPAGDTRAKAISEAVA